MGMFNSPWQSRLADEEYRKLSLLVACQTGICLGNGVREHITRKVWQQMAALNIAWFTEYLGILENAPQRRMTSDLCKDLEFARFERRCVSQQAQYVTEWA